MPWNCWSLEDHIDCKYIKDGIGTLLSEYAATVVEKKRNIEINEILPYDDLTSPDSEKCICILLSTLSHEECVSSDKTPLKEKKK